MQPKVLQKIQQRQVTFRSVLKLTSTGFVAFAFCTSLFAETGIQPKLDQLKQNAENSQKNLDQYEGNLKTVEKNIMEIDQAMITLGRQRQQIQKNIANVEKGRQELDLQKKSVDALITKEKVKIEKDQEQINQIKKRLAELEENKQRRELNIVSYQKKLDEIEQGHKDWQSQRDQVSSIESEIANKEKVAKEDRQKWTEKRDTYKGEVVKWKKEAKTNLTNYKRYKKLSE